MFTNGIASFRLVSYSVFPLRKRVHWWDKIAAV